MRDCRWCDEGRPWMAGQEGVQHTPLYAGGDHSGTMCHNNRAIYPLPITDDRDLDYVDPRLREEADLVVKVPAQKSAVVR